MSHVLIASDSPDVAAEVRSVLPEPEFLTTVVTTGAAVLPMAQKLSPDLVVLDFQIGNMGGMAACLELRLEHSGGRLLAIPVLLLVDRRADVFLARRSAAQGWLVKPLDPIRLRKATRALLAGEPYEDQSFLPSPV